MAPDDLHDFFVAGAGVAGALIGLLFVAVSVAPERLAEGKGTALHRIRASAALTAFTNALVISLTALLPGAAGGAAVTVGVIGLLFVAGSLIQLLRARRFRLRDLRDEIFLVSLAAVFVFDLIQGIQLRRHHGTAADHFDSLALLVLVAFLIGIGRAWDLINGPNIGLRQELLAQAGRIVGAARSSGDAPAGDDAPAADETPAADDDDDDDDDDKATGHSPDGGRDGA